LRQVEENQADRPDFGMVVARPPSGKRGSWPAAWPSVGHLSCTDRQIKAYFLCHLSLPPASKRWPSRGEASVVALARGVAHDSGTDFCRNH
jgi:hypothetical protein